MPISLILPLLLSIINVIFPCSSAANLSDIIISDYDFNDPEDGVLHVNANEFFSMSENETLTRPQLSVTVDYETPEVNIEQNNVDPDNYEDEMDEKYLTLDSYSLHIPKFHPQVICFRRQQESNA